MTVGIGVNAEDDEVVGKQIFVAVNTTIVESGIVAISSVEQVGKPRVVGYLLQRGSCGREGSVMVVFGIGVEQGFVVYEVRAEFLIAFEIRHKIVQLRHPLVECSMYKIAEFIGDFCVPYANLIDASLIQISTDDERRFVVLGDYILGCKCLGTVAVDVDEDFGAIAQEHQVIPSVGNE